MNSFRPETVLFRPGGVNLRTCLCGIPMYASAQVLDFLAMTKNSSFPFRKLHWAQPEFPDTSLVAVRKGFSSAVAASLPGGTDQHDHRPGSNQVTFLPLNRRFRAGFATCRHSWQRRVDEASPAEISVQ